MKHKLAECLILAGLSALGAVGGETSVLAAWTLRRKPFLGSGTTRGIECGCCVGEANAIVRRIFRLHSALTGPDIPRLWQARMRASNAESVNAAAI